MKNRRRATKSTARFSHRILGVVLFFLFSVPVLSVDDVQRGAVAGSRLDLNRGWYLSSIVLVQDSAQTISSPSFRPAGWYPVNIPSTVLAALVKNDVYPNPYVGMNNMLIPDASEEFNRKYDLHKHSYLPDKRNPWQDPYWFRTEFVLPEGQEGHRVWLNLAGIHYRAEIWLNGQQIADPKKVVGMFGHWSFDISQEVSRGSRNALAIKIYPLDHPGLPGEPQLEALGTFGLNGGETGDIGKNVTMQCAVGWDWIPAVRDRNMGIWQEVYLSFTGLVDVRDPHVKTDLLLPDFDRAYLEVSADLVNTSSSPLAGDLWLSIQPRGALKPEIVVKRRVELKPHQLLSILFDTDAYSELIVHDPHLWWPHDYGDPNLYMLEIRFELEENISDIERCLFGIREIDSRVETVDTWARRDFYVNGERILLRGGAWVPDMLLGRGSSKLSHELLFSQKANLNTVRIWGGGVTPPDRFFSICDELGLLVWHDFWITGDCQGTWGKGSQAFPLEAGVFLKNAADVVKSLRNHPSIMVWTAGNEGYPREEIYVPLRKKILAGLDGTRPFLPSSGYREPPQAWGLSWPDDKKAGTYSGGPYHWVEPGEYYRLVEAGKDWLFKNEVGLPSIPVLDSLRKFIPDLSPDPMLPFPLNHVWGYHDACEGNGKFSLYDQAIRDRYGEPKDLRDYVQKAQLLNAESYRAVFEAVNHGKDHVAGMLLWKTNPAWPSVIWQLYDWYLRPHAGYYFAKKACEPQHIQLNPLNLGVEVVNHRLEGNNDLLAVVEVYARDMHIIWEKSLALDMDPSSVKSLFTIPPLQDLQDEVTFVQLRLETRAEMLLSDNFYWLAEAGDFTSLCSIPRSEVKVELIQKETGKDFLLLRFRFTNPTSTLAFFLNPSIRWRETGEEILPSFWSDNYFSVLPGKMKQVSVQVRNPELAKKAINLRIEAWNLDSFEFDLEK